APVRLMEPYDSFGMCGADVRREGRVGVVLARVPLVGELDHRLGGVHGDAARPRPVVAELARARRREDERAHALRAIERNPLRDAPAHRVTEHMRGLETER